MSYRSSLIRSAALFTAVVLGSPLSAQLTRLQFGGLPTNLHADFSQVFLAPGTTPGSFFFLAPFSGTPAGRFEFSMFNWDGHPMMQSVYPGGWYEARFQFPQWAYLSNAPCGLQPAVGNLLPHGGIDSTYDYGPPLFTGPVRATHQPLPGWVLGDVGVPGGVSGNPFTAANETFALFLTDYWNDSLNACAGGTPVSWVGVEVQLSLVRH